MDVFLVIKKVLAALKHIQFYLFCLLAFSAGAQDYIANCQFYTVKDGLSHRSVRGIVQDKEGFIWIATQQGLNRFDGHRFKYWTKNENGLPFDNIGSLYFDTDGLLWLFFGNEKDVMDMAIFDTKTGVVTPFSKKFEGQFKLEAECFVSGFASDDKGNLYLGTTNPAGYVVYNPKTGFKNVVISSQGSFAPRLSTGSGTVWGKYVPFGQITPYLHTIECDGQGKILHDIGVSSIKGASYSADGGFCYGVLGGNTWQYFPEHPDQVKMVEDAPPTKNFQPFPMWLKLCGGKVNAYGTEIKEAATGKLIFNLPVELESGVTAWMVDRDGGLWVGSQLGLARIIIKPNRFKALAFNGDNHTMGLPIRGIYSLPDGDLLVNTESNGQLKINKQTGSAVPFAQAKDGANHASGQDANGNIYSLKRLYTSVLEIVDRNNNRKELPINTKTIAWNFYNDGKKLWISSNVLLKYDLSSQAIDSFNQFNGFDALANSTVYFMGKDPSGNLWACAGNGLYQMDTEKGVLARYWSGGEGKYHLPADYFLHFYCDKDGVFWLATVQGGLIRWDKDKTGEAKQFGRKSGLPGQTVYAVYEDNHGHLWMPSDFGIVQFDKTQEQVRRVYGITEGITHQEFNRISHFRDADGTLYFGGLNGVTAFNPDDFYENAKVESPNLVISECMKYNTRLGKMDTITQEVKSSHFITLMPNESYCTIDLALLSFEETDLIQYAYRFDGDENWTTLPGRTLYLGGLSYGQQILHIKALAANGIWSDKQLELTVLQMKPFYLRTWFLLLMAVLILGGFIAFFRWRTWQLHTRQKLLETEIGQATAHIAEQAQELRRLDEAKSRFFANVSHELRTPLTLILGPIGSAIKGKRYDQKLLQTALMHGKSLLRLVNQILDLSKLESGKLELQEAPILFDALMSRVLASFESHAERIGIAFLFENKTDKQLVLNMDASKTETILNNILSNALKFTPTGGRISILAEDLGQRIRISVSDTGRGIHSGDLPFIFERFFQTKQTGAAIEGGTGIGLALCRELALLMGGEINALSPDPAQNGKGSVFILEIPKKEMAMGSLGAEQKANALLDEMDKDEMADGLDSDAQEESNPAPFSILVVEDNYSLRDYLRGILSKTYRVHTAENGEAALAFLNGLGTSALPDLILSDVMMPVMDGFQLLEKVKGDERFRHLPMVMLTARADVQDRLRALRIGVDDYLLKPFEEEELLTRLDNLILNYQARKNAQIEQEAEIEQGAENTTAEPGQTAPAKLNTEELQWLERLEASVRKKMGNTNFTADELADDMAMSRSSLFRQLKRLTGLAPTYYIDEVRYQFARSQFESGESRSVKATAYQAGFLHVGNFSRQYFKRFGKYPSEY